MSSERNPPADPVRVAVRSWPRVAPLLVLAVLLLLGSVLALVNMARLQHDANASMTQAITRIAVADGLAQALDRGDRPQASRLLDRLTRLSADDAAHRAGVAAIAARLDSEAGREQAIAAYRSAERARIIRSRSLADARLMTLLGVAGLAVLLGVLAGAAGAWVWAGRALALRAAVRSAYDEAERVTSLLEALGAATPDAIYVKNLEGRYTYVNQAALLATGRTWPELAGRTTEEIAETPPGQEPSSDIDRRIMATGVGEITETVGQSPDGRPRHYRITRFPIRTTDGRIAGVGGIGIDTTDIVRAIAEREDAMADLEARKVYLQLILDTVPDAMIVIDEGGVIREFSPAAVRLFGWTRDEVVGCGSDMLMPELYRAQHRRGLVRYAETGERRVIGVGRVVVGQRRDGSTFPIELAVGEMRAGGERYYVGFARDLTERHATERHLQGVQAELAHMARLSAMGEMASALAHELNQPLSATANYLQGSLKLLERSPDQIPLVMEGLGDANDQIFRAGEIIRRLRDFVGRGEAETKVENMGQLLEEAGVLAMLGARDRGVHLSYQTPGREQLVLVNRVQIQQVVLNLMRNALEAMAGMARQDLTVSFTARDADGMVRVSVQDSGPGISETVAAQLFQPFVSTKQTGMGVGLSISRTIIEAHGGRLWTEPAPGGGAVFSFTVRAAPVGSGGEPGGDEA